ncbi:MAG: YraN family protein [Candidatus Saccharimonadales bacterium]
MKTTIRGKQAETAVAERLACEGYEIITQNWKTKVCEIDVVARKNGIIYFVEVKYRSGDSQGVGLDYITAQKLRQLHFAASIWNQQNGWGGDYRLLAASVTTNGLDYIIEEIIELE